MLERSKITVTLRVEIERPDGGIDKAQSVSVTDWVDDPPQFADFAGHGIREATLAAITAIQEQYPPRQFGHPRLSEMRDTTPRDLLGEPQR